ncbi:Uncharacterized protein TCM_021564 [Theobroma cacao]|uniref:Uncharacterized protein n=1 Tax=Theobroma cacao TaxID=3641 RepID=A0A061ERM3_THECC|nr:Uncharacterized protein TCM_021564 [Theobroma cacao]
MSLHPQHILTQHHQIMHVHFPVSHNDKSTFNCDQQQFECVIIKIPISFFPFRIRFTRLMLQLNDRATWNLGYYVEG